MNTPRFVVASGSPRRHLLLRAAGFAFDIVVPDVDETVVPGEDPGAMVLRLAQEKARSVEDDTAVVLGADTTVVRDGNILGKPSDEEEAVAMLTSLSGRSHSVLTGWMVRMGTEERFGVSESRVRFHTRSEPELVDYVARTQPFDKAGAYAIQGDRGWLIENVAGSRSNVMGLPIRDVTDAVSDFGIVRSTSQG